MLPKCHYCGLTLNSDIDECIERSVCDHNCTNTDGSYHCACVDGYGLKLDNHTCAGDDYTIISYVKVYILTYRVDACNKYVCMYVCEYACM